MAKLDLYAQNDTFICGKSKKRNFIKCPYLLLGNGASDSCTRDLYITLMLFDLRAIENDRFIDKAELYFYPNYKRLGKENLSFSLEIYRILNCYNPYTVTWQIGPDISSAGCSTCINLKKCNCYTKIDITPLVKRWVRKELPNYGLAMIGEKNKRIISINSSRGFNAPFLRMTSHCPVY